MIRRDFIGFSKRLLTCCSFAVFAVSTFKEPTAEDSFDSPSSALSTSALASLVPVKEHSFVKISAAAGVKSAQKNESAFPGVALVASSDGAPINDLTELVTDPDVVEKTAAQAFVRTPKRRAFNGKVGGRPLCLFSSFSASPHLVHSSGGVRSVLLRTYTHRWIARDR